MPQGKEENYSRVRGPGGGKKWGARLVKRALPPTTTLGADKVARPRKMRAGPWGKLAR